MEMVTGTINPLVASSEGGLYLQTNPNASDVLSGIDCLIRTAWHSGGRPELEKVFGQLVLFSGVESDGDLTITPYVGGTDAAVSATLTHDLTKSEERLGRLGLGRLVSLQFQHTTINERLRLYGYQIPIVPVGVR